MADATIGQAVILCGGLGTRLGALTADTPKPLLPVGGVPFLERLLFEIRRFGLRRVLFLAAFQADSIRAFAAEACARLDIESDVIVEPARAGTGGALRHALSRLDDAFLLFNGDSFFDLNLLDLGQALFDYPGALAALALRAVDDASRYGTVEFDGHRVLGFAEKRGVAAPGLVNGGVYAMRRALAETLGPTCSLEQDGLAKLAPGGRIIGRKYDGFFIDIGIPADYERAHGDVPRAQRRGAVFLDGNVVLVDTGGGGSDVDRGPPHRGVIAAIKRLNDQGLFVFLVADDHEDAPGAQDRWQALVRLLADAGAHIDDVMMHADREVGFVPIDVDGAGPGLRRPHAASWPIDLQRSTTILGDDSGGLAGGRPDVPAIRLGRDESLEDVVAILLSRLVERPSAW